MAASGQTINDRLNAVRYALSGQGLARTVCKATTLEVLGPKKKHIDYLLACTNEPNVSTPQLANLLIERTQHTNWAVVFKSLISIHHLMSYGNERFTQYLATSNHNFELADFMDRTTPQGYNMSAFVRRYAKYINDKTISYRLLAIDLCKIRSGNDNALRTMNMDNLSKTLPIVQKQFDSLLEFCAEPKDLSNGVIMAAFRLLYKDLVRLYVAYQEAIINLLERYFKLGRKKAREALDMYKKYLARMDKVAEFLRVVEASGLDKSEQIDLTRSPASILPALEQHLAQLEARKRGATPVSPGHNDEQPPDEQDQGAKEEKENERPDKEAPVAIVEEVSKQTEQSEEPDKREKSPGPTTSSADAPKAPPPPKPARPVSPAVSPKKSPLAAKPPPPPPASATTSSPPASNKPAATPSGAEKKLPPSRPPPPSSSAAAPSPTPPPAAEAAPKSSTSPVSVSSAQPTPGPPPPPPPPLPAQHSAPPPVQATSTLLNTNGQTADAVEGDTQPDPPASSCSAIAVAEVQNEGVNQDANDTSDLNHHDGENGGCAAAAVAAPAASELSQDADLNHVNNGTGGHVDEQAAPVDAGQVDEALPPPPPPIDDADDLHSPPPPPVGADGEINGQNGSANE